jgi:hypothetical protein
VLQNFWRARFTAQSDPKDGQSWSIFSDHSRHSGGHLYAATARFVFRAILDAGTGIALQAALLVLIAWSTGASSARAPTV